MDEEDTVQLLLYDCPDLQKYNAILVTYGADSMVAPFGIIIKTHVADISLDVIHLVLLPMII